LLKNKYFKYFIVTFHVCLFIIKKIFPPLRHLIYIYIFFFNLQIIARMTWLIVPLPNPLQFWTWLEMQLNQKENWNPIEKCYRSTHHSSCMMQWWVLSHQFNHSVNPMFSLRRYIGNQMQLPFSLFSRIGWSISA
jgi:hypothetical protein